MPDKELKKIVLRKFCGLHKNTYSELNKIKQRKKNKQEVQQIEIIKNQTGILAPKNTINGMRNVESFKS